MSNAAKKPLEALIEVVELESIRLLDLASRTSIRNTESFGPLEIKIDLRTEGTRQPPNGPIEVTVGLELALRSPQESDSKVPPQIEVRGTFLLRYRLPEDFPADDPVLKEFAATNGLYNVWPYWRELVQDTVARMGLPPLAVPLLKMHRKQADTEQSAEAPGGA